MTAECPQCPWPVHFIRYTLQTKSWACSVSLRQKGSESLQIWTQPTQQHRSKSAITKKESTQLQAEMSTILLANPRTRDRNQSRDEQTNKTEAFFLTPKNTFSILIGINRSLWLSFLMCTHRNTSPSASRAYISRVQPTSEWNYFSNLVSDTYDFSIWEAEARGLWIQGPSNETGAEVTSAIAP